MNANVYVLKDYENEPPTGPKKQTQSNPILSAVGGLQMNKKTNVFLKMALPDDTVLTACC